MLKMQFFKADLDNNYKQVLQGSLDNSNKKSRKKNVCRSLKHYRKHIVVHKIYKSVKLELKGDIIILNHEDVKTF